MKLAKSWDELPADEKEVRWFVCLITRCFMYTNKMFLCNAEIYESYGIGSKQ
jgi:hypothetical protein